MAAAWGRANDRAHFASGQELAALSAGSDVADRTRAASCPAELAAVVALPGSQDLMAKVADLAAMCASAIVARLFFGSLL